MSFFVLILIAAAGAFAAWEALRLLNSRRAAAHADQGTRRGRILDDPQEYLRAQWLEREPDRTSIRQAITAADAAVNARRQGLAERLADLPNLTVFRRILVTVMCLIWIAAITSHALLDEQIFLTVLNGNTFLATTFTVLTVAILITISVLLKLTLRSTSAGSRPRAISLIGLCAAFLTVAAFFVQLAPQRADIEFQPAIAAAQQNLTIATQDPTDPLPVTFDQQQLDQLLADRQHAAQVAQSVAGGSAAVELATGWFALEGVALGAVLLAKRRVASAERAAASARNDQERSTARWVRLMSRTLVRAGVPVAVLQNFQFGNPGASGDTSSPLPREPAPTRLENPANLAKDADRPVSGVASQAISVDLDRSDPQTVVVPPLDHDES